MNQDLVCSVRMNPQEAMGIVDTLDVLGISKDNLSFSQALKLAIAAYIERARQTGTIPRRDGFEFSEMLAPFTKPDLSKRSAKLKSAAELSKPNTIRRVLAEHETPERRSRKVLYDELMFKRNTDPENFSDEDLMALAPLIEEFQE